MLSIIVETNHTGIQVVANADELILFLRNKHHLSNPQIANLCKVPTTTVSRWLNAKRASYDKLLPVIENYKDSIKISEAIPTDSFEKFIFIQNEFDDLNDFLRLVNNKIALGYMPVGGAQIMGDKIFISMLKK